MEAHQGSFLYLEILFLCHLTGNNGNFFGIEHAEMYDFALNDYASIPVAVLFLLIDAFVPVGIAWEQIRVVAIG